MELREGPFRELLQGVMEAEGRVTGLVVVVVVIQAAVLLRATLLAVVVVVVPISTRMGSLTL